LQPVNNSTTNQQLLIITNHSNILAMTQDGAITSHAAKWPTDTTTFVVPQYSYRNIYTTFTIDE